MTDKRVAWIDMARCYGIILMVWGHSICPKFAYIWLYSFHMPLFFFLAGVTLNFKKYDTIEKFVFAKIKSVLVPYFILCVINICWKFIEILLRERNYTVLVKYFVSIFYQNRVDQYTIGLWFLPCLFITQIVMYLICAKKGQSISIWKYICFVMSSFFLGFAYYKFIGRILPWGLDAVPISLGFMLMGYIFHVKQYQSFINKTIGISAVLCNIIFLSVNYRLNGYNVDMWGTKYGNPLAFIVAAVSGIVAVCWISKEYTNKYLEATGKNSMLIYGVHQIMLAVLGRISNQFFGANSVPVVYIVSIVEVVIAITGICYVSPIYNKFMNWLWRRSKRI